MYFCSESAYLISGSTETRLFSVVYWSDPLKNAMFVSNDQMDLNNILQITDTNFTSPLLAPSVLLFQMRWNNQTQLLCELDWFYCSRPDFCFSGRLLIDRIVPLGFFFPIPVDVSPVPNTLKSNSTIIIRLQCQTQNKLAGVNCLGRMRAVLMINNDNVNGWLAIRNEW